jgi:hypothetical protein
MQIGFYPTQRPILCAPVSRVKQVQCEADNSPSSRSEVTNGRSFISRVPTRLVMYTAVCDRISFEVPNLRTWAVIMLTEWVLNDLDSIPGRRSNFSFHQNGSGTHPASRSRGTGGKAAGRTAELTPPPLVPPSLPHSLFGVVINGQLVPLHDIWINKLLQNCAILIISQCAFNSFEKQLNCRY